MSNSNRFPAPMRAVAQRFSLRYGFTAITSNLS